MKTKKKTLYEILEVSPTASYSDIKAAHKRLSLALMSASLGLSRGDIGYKLNVLDVALHTLSTPMLRDEYDAQIAPAAAPGYGVVPIKSNIVSLGDDAQAIRIVAALEENHKLAASVGDSHLFPVKEVSSTIDISVGSLKKILRVIISLAVLASVLQVGRCAFQGGRASEAAKRAEDQVVIQEYYQTYGERPASRAEAELLMRENSRIENERRAAEFAERKMQEEERRFAEESQRQGEAVHENLVRAEQQAIYEAAEKQRYLAEERRMQEEAAQEAERIHIENERQKLGLY